MVIEKPFAATPCISTANLFRTDEQMLGFSRLVPRVPPKKSRHRLNWKGHGHHLEIQDGAGGTECVYMCLLFGICARVLSVWASNKIGQRAHMTTTKVPRISDWGSCHTAQGRTCSHAVPHGLAKVTSTCNDQWRSWKMLENQKTISNHT